MGSNEDAARMRVNRALEKLRLLLAHRGVSLSAAALGTALAAQAVSAAPAGLSAALAGSALSAASTGGAVGTLLKLMTMTKFKAGLAGIVIIAGAGSPLILQHQAQARLRQETESARLQHNWFTELEGQRERLSNLLAQAENPGSAGELEKLRAEVAGLRKQTNALQALRDEDRRLQAALAKAREDLLGPGAMDTEPSQELLAKETYAIKLSNALRQFAARHEGRFPTNFEEAATFVSAATSGETNLAPDQFEIVYRGDQADASGNKYAHPKRIILFRERQPWMNTDGKWVKFYEMLPGQKWFVSVPNGNFEAWEAQHIVSPDSSNP
jgi:hypothetical protein